MAPDDREFGILIGKVEAIGEAIAELRRTNTAEHAANGRRAERLESKVDEALQGHEKRIDSLEKTRDEGSGAAKLIKLGQGAGVFVLMVLTYFASKGGVG
jgi:hypothetical protein